MALQQAGQVTLLKTFQWLTLSRNFNIPPKEHYDQSSQPPNPTPCCSYTGLFCLHNNYFKAFETLLFPLPGRFYLSTSKSWLLCASSQVPLLQRDLCWTPSTVLLPLSTLKGCYPPWCLLNLYKVFILRRAASIFPNDSHSECVVVFGF